MVNNNTAADAWLQVDGAGKLENGQWVVQDLNFTQGRGQKVAIAGESGSGKTTLLRMIGGLTQPDAGKIWFEGKKVIGPLERLLPGHPGIAFLSQYSTLHNHYRVEEILDYGNDLEPAEAARLYEICHIHHLLQRKTNEGLSGGERQRISLAKLLTARPRLLLLDEPFSHLDALHKHTMRQVLANLGHRLGITCLMVSHDPTDMLSWADIILVMKDGRLVQQGTPENIYHQPADAYVAGLFGEYNLLGPDQASILGLKTPPLPRGKHIMLRPEWLVVTPQAEVSGMKAIVRHCGFRGPHYALQLESGAGTLIAHTNDPVTLGETVFVQLKHVNLWYI